MSWHPYRSCPLEKWPSLVIRGALLVSVAAPILVASVCIYVPGSNSSEQRAALKRARDMPMAERQTILTACP